MKVSIYGASGRTGRLVAKALADLGIALRLIGRDQGGLQKVARGGGIPGPCLVAALSEPTQLDIALRGSDLVINCAGPYSQTCEPVLAAALRNGVHYMDMSGEA